MGASYFNPYVNLCLAAQVLPFIEASITYRFFQGLDDPILTPLGFGVRSDKGGNVKFSFCDSSYCDCHLPDLAVGLIDFVGTDDFFSVYVVATQSLLKLNLELSLGWSYGQLNGFFGGGAWTPFRCRSSPWIRGLSLAAEYDPINYRNPKTEPHPLARHYKSRINFGAKYQICNYWDFSISRIKGEETAASFSLHLGLGDQEGWCPKIFDPPRYRAPKIYEPIGMNRPEDVMIHDIACALQCQSICLNRAWICTDACGQMTLWLDIENVGWRWEREFRRRLECVLGTVAPSNVPEIRATVTAMGMASQQYVYRTCDLRRFAANCMSEWELAAISPMRDGFYPQGGRKIFEHKLPWFRFLPKPFARTFFGSAKGKFKYAIGAEAIVGGELPWGFLYEAALSFTVLSTIHNIGSIDRISPSQIVNVRSDSVLYFQQDVFTFPYLFIQKNFNLGTCSFARLAVGYFEPAYAGIAGEFLVDSTRSNLAIGISGALFKKRNYSGMGFQKTLTKLEGWKPTQLNYNYLSQYFLDIYYNIQPLCLVAQATLGGFLAGDIGGSIRLTRYYPSGLRLYGWYTYTNYSDLVHGDRYNDFGIGFVLPLDLFLPKSCRYEVGKAMSAWLRDVGARAETGFQIYPILYAERNL
jgi:Exopolysaccharide biosynthesis protein YbjH